MTTAASRDYIAPVPAGGEIPLQIDGDFIHIKSTTAPIKVIVHDGESTMSAGNKKRYPVYDKVRLKNDTGSDIIVTFVAGFGDFDEATVTGTVTTTTPGSVADAVDVTIGANSSVSLVPINAGRKTVILTSLDSNSSTIRIGTVNVTSSRGYPLEPGSSVELATTAQIYGKNTGITAHKVAVLETTT